MQEPHFKFAIALFGLGVSVLHSEHSHAISRMKAPFDPLRERWLEYRHSHPGMNGNRTQSTPSAAEAKRKPSTSVPAGGSVKPLR
ncbi:hypothetical protein [Methylocaldum szegediense]|uniref:Uncharacterized protein n=1 Tax=Methylocaldum szegediense TaxID=73780 RepID=A0ABM9I5A2_9GAMM|nr:hypothetical protein [Methylocaldum szegediense]CAI8897855.1 protein of unknown function [Methylocaldum szegediense]